MLRTIRIGLSLGAENPAVVTRLVERAMLDPDLASTLLTRKVAEAGTPVWNAKLQKYPRWAEAGRAVNEDEAD